MNRGIIISGLFLSLFGCTALGTAALDAINPMKDDKGIKATVQLGKENHNTSTKQLAQIDTKVVTDTRYNTDSIGTVDNSSDIPWWALLMCILVGILVRPIDFIRDWRKAINETTNKNKEE